jgi:hypothetical protein
MSTAIEIQRTGELSEWKSPTQIKARVQAIQRLMAEVLKPGNKDNEWSGDYGIIPGTGKKPSLWKSGSEQILAMFQIAVDPVVEDLSTEDCYRYRVTTRLTNSLTGQFLGAGVGEASSDETKYKWRRTYSEKEFNAADPDRRRIKYSQRKDANNMWVDLEELQVRQEPADVANTILKMAKKRSQIDATLTVTGASSMFDQDLEDLTEDQKRAMQDDRKGKRAKAQTSVKCSECHAEGGHLPNCSQRQAQQSPAQAQPPAKADKVMCGDCGKVDGHEPTCKYHESPQASSASGLTKSVVLILGIDRLLKKADKQGKQEPYIRLHVVNPANEDFDLFVWHKTPQESFVPTVIDKHMLCEFSTGKRKDGTPYYSLEHILELAGVPYVDNKPAQQGEMSAEEEF